MVSKASEDLPEPEIPEMTTNWSRGISTVRFLRLWARAPTTTIFSWGMAGLNWINCSTGGAQGIIITDPVRPPWSGHLTELSGPAADPFIRSAHKWDCRGSPRGEWFGWRSLARRIGAGQGLTAPLALGLAGRGARLAFGAGLQRGGILDSALKLRRHADNI